MGPGATWRDWLAAVPSDGVGIDLCQGFLGAAASDYPQLRFQRPAIEDFTARRRFDAALLLKTMESVYDIGAVLDKAHEGSSRKRHTPNYHC